MDALTRLLSELVAIPSLNPMGRPVVGPGYFEGRLTEYLLGWFGSIGVEVERQTVAPGRDNLIARYQSPGSRRTLLFDAHQDTVPADGMTIDPFDPVVEGGRLHGRGSCDIKGGMAAMLAAFARLVRERPGGSASVIMACTVDEEYTHIGSSRLAATDLGVDLAIVAEPTKLQIVDRHKGAVRWKMKARGVACHSSTPDLGENAIYAMARVISALEDYAAVLARSEPDPVLGPPSLSVGRVEGGISANVVPDWCEIDLDRRVIPGEQVDDCQRLAREFLGARLGGLMERVELWAPWVNMPPLVPGLAARFLPELREAIGRVGGREPEVIGVPYGTDAGPLNAVGIPCIVFGPGDIAQAHTEDEWVDLDQVRLASEMYYEIARGLG